MIRFLLAVLVALPAAAGAAPARSKLAVMDLKGVQGVSEGTASILTAIVVADAARAGYDVISQADIAAMIGFEKQKQMLGCTDQASCLAEIGGALGVDYVVSGQVGQIGSRYHLSLQLLESRKAKVLARSARFSDKDEDALASAAQATLADLLGTVGRAAPLAPASAASAKAIPLPPPPAAGTGDARKPDLSAPAPAPAEPRHDPSWRPNRTASYWVMGGGVAAVLVGALFRGAASSEYQELEDAWRDPAYASLYDEKKGRITQLTNAGNGLLAAGIVTAGVGGFMWWRAGRPPAVSVAPEVGDGRVGLVAAGRF